ncbi:MAG: hypothetical protein ABIS03_14890 [Gemmatimonadaceae bacterium]
MKIEKEIEQTNRKAFVLTVATKGMSLISLVTPFSSTQAPVGIGLVAVAVVLWLVSFIF